MLSSGITSLKQIKYLGKFTLFYLEKPDIKISMELYFTDRDQLYFDGYNIGKSVEAIWGDTDYEYTYILEPEEVDKFYQIFNLAPGDKSGLLFALKQRFSGNKAYSLFGEFMNANHIAYTALSWSWKA